MTAAKDPFRNAESDVRDAEEALNEGYDVTACRETHRRRMSIAEVLRYDDYSSWGQWQPGELAGMSPEERHHEFVSFRGEDWAERAETWVKDGIPAIVLAKFSVKGRERDEVIADGRGRVSFAVGMYLNQDLVRAPSLHVITLSCEGGETARENPVARESGGLVCMGREVEFDLREPPTGRYSAGKTVTAPKDAGMLRDEDGTYWPKCSLLVANFQRGDEEVETKEGANYFGRGADVKRGSVELPPREISSWQKLGEIETIFYDRAGTKHPGYFKHTFNKPRGLYRLVFLVKGKAAKQPAVLYTLFQRRSGRTFYRVELPGGCIVDDRGIVLP